MSTSDALLTLADRVADAVHGVLCSLSCGPVGKGSPVIFGREESPFESISYPAVATDVAYTDGVTGGNVFAITKLGVRKLAAAMMSSEPPAEDDASEPDELEMSALGEAMNQMVAASAGALSSALGYAVAISPPTTRTLLSAESAGGLYPHTPHATGVSFAVLGQPCRLVQLVPHAFVVRLEHALDASPQAGAEEDRERAFDPRVSARLRAVPVRVTAELGCAEVPLRLLAHPQPGHVLELDRDSGAPIDLCVNGRRFAVGELLQIGEEWALRIERMLDPSPLANSSRTGGTV